jgi:CHAD domain-containing protein
LTSILAFRFDERSVPAKAQPIGEDRMMARSRMKAVRRAAGDRRARLVAGGLIGAAAVAAAKAGIERVAGRDARTYRLREKEGVHDGVIRIAIGRADDALEQLGRAREGDLSSGIHEARKDLKKIRSLLRLVRDGLGKKAYRRENCRYRDAARLLSGARDAEIRVRTLELLERRFGPELAATEVAALRKRLEGERPRGADAGQLDRLDRAAAAIAEGRTLIGDWPLGDGGDWELLEPGLRRSYRRGRKAMKRVREDPGDESAHEWRKRVKDLWYHLRLLRDADPEELGPAAEQVHELSDLLGDHHDLSVLAEWIRESDRSATAGPLLDAISRRQAELLESALELGARLYAEKPRRFSGRLEACWRQWRG